MLVFFPNLHDGVGYFLIQSPPGTVPDIKPVIKKDRSQEAYDSKQHLLNMNLITAINNFQSLCEYMVASESLL